MNTKLISALLISTALSFINIVKADNVENKQDILQQASFPQKLETIINLPGKKDVIDVPMQREFYEKRFTESLIKSGDYRKTTDAIISSHIIDDNLLTVKFKTTGMLTSFSVVDEDTSYFYDYTIGNGYVLETGISIYINRSDRRERYHKTNYLKDKISSYLVDKGFVDTTSLWTSFFDSEYTYEKNDVIVTIIYEEVNYIPYFRIKATTKDIIKNSDWIMLNIIKNDAAIEFKPLDKLL